MLALVKLHRRRVKDKRSHTVRKIQTLMSVRQVRGCDCFNTASRVTCASLAVDRVGCRAVCSCAHQVPDLALASPHLRQQLR